MCIIIINWIATLVYSTFNVYTLLNLTLLYSCIFDYICDRNLMVFWCGICSFKCNIILFFNHISHNLIQYCGPPLCCCEGSEANSFSVGDRYMKKQDSKFQPPRSLALDHDFCLKRF